MGRKQGISPCWLSAKWSHTISQSSAPAPSLLWAVSCESQIWLQYHSFSLWNCAIYKKSSWGFFQVCPWFSSSIPFPFCPVLFATSFTVQCIVRFQCHMPQAIFTLLYVAWVRLPSLQFVLHRANVFSQVSLPANTKRCNDVRLASGSLF